MPFRQLFNSGEARRERDRRENAPRTGRTTGNRGTSRDQTGRREQVLAVPEVGGRAGAPVRCREQALALPAAGGRAGRRERALAHPEYREQALALPERREQNLAVPEAGGRAGRREQALALQEYREQALAPPGRREQALALSEAGGRAEHREQALAVPDRRDPRTEEQKYDETWQEHRREYDAGPSDVEMDDPSLDSPWMNWRIDDVSTLLSQPIRLDHSTPYFSENVRGRPATVANCITSMSLNDLASLFTTTKPGGGQLVSGMEVWQSISQDVEYATVRNEHVSNYVDSIVKEVTSKIQLSEAKTKAENYLRRALAFSELDAKAIRSFCIPPEFGGTRTLEIVLLGSRKVDSERQEIMFARYCDSSRLSSKFAWLAANHDPKKLMAWMNFKIFQLLKEKLAHRVGWLEKLGLSSS